MNLLLPTMCEYCYRGRLLLMIALGVLIGGYIGSVYALAFVVASAFFSFVIPAFRHD